ncbi:MAG: hypothetical protein KDK11_14730 [Maritimibacter sp.]|nr:hypothetical protein [Maritimibacter sp.]
MTRRPAQKTPPGMRTRDRADGSTRAWWEPNASARALGFQPVELDGNRLTWSAREAERINREVAAARKGDTPRGDPRHAKPGSRTIDDLVETYRRSRQFAAKKPATQRDYLGAFRLISRKWGRHPVSEFTKPVMYAWHETLAETAGQAQAVALIRKMSLLFSHAELLGWRAEGSNPCSRLKMAVPKPRPRWLTWAELDALVAAADRLGLAATGTAILLSALQGQRQTDVIEASPAAFTHVEIPGEAAAGRVWIWQLTRSKRGTEGAMPLHPEVTPRVRAALAAHPGSPTLLVDELGGLPFTPDAIRDRFARVRAAAAKDTPSLRDVQFRDLRRTFSVLARAAGADKADVGDVLGNTAATDARLGQTYMPPTFYTARRAVAMVRRPTPSEEEKKA